eukprot:scaffold551781_cov17-Prasinocladus_malaysianus.AAC.1
MSEGCYEAEAHIGPTGSDQPLTEAVQVTFTFQVCRFRHKNTKMVQKYGWSALNALNCSGWEEWDLDRLIDTPAVRLN